MTDTTRFKSPEEVREYLRSEWSRTDSSVVERMNNIHQVLHSTTKGRHRPHLSESSADLARVNIGRRRRAESDGQWRRRYGLRAGIEGTNSELKRRHGLGRLRVRGGERVRLSVYLKALAVID